MAYETLRTTLFEQVQADLREYYRLSRSHLLDPAEQHKEQIHLLLWNFTLKYVSVSTPDADTAEQLAANATTAIWAVCERNLPGLLDKSPGYLRKVAANKCIDQLRARGLILSREEADDTLADAVADSPCLDPFTIAGLALHTLHHVVYLQTCLSDLRSNAGRLRRIIEAAIDLCWSALRSVDPRFGHYAAVVDAEPLARWLSRDYDTTEAFLEGITHLWPHLHSLCPSMTRANFDTGCKELRARPFPSLPPAYDGELPIPKDGRIPSTFRLLPF